MIDANDDLGTPTKHFKLCFVTGMWQRPSVFRMFAEGIKTLQDHFRHRIDIICCVSGSEGEQSKALALSYGFHYVETPNKPLGKKMNEALVLAKSLNPDYCLLLGSDDLVGVRLMSRYLDLMESGIDYACLMDCYFYDLRTKRGLYWGGYVNRVKAAGLGKLISASLLDKMEWSCFPDDYNRMLDSGFEGKLKELEFTQVKINLKQENLFAVDLKSSTNITQFFRWRNSNFVDGKELLYKNLPKHLANLIYGTV